MKSPFPGMDPYLEAHWRDVHTRLIVYASDQLRSQMRLRYDDLNYRTDPAPALGADDAAWANELLRDRRSRNHTG